MIRLPPKKKPAETAPPEVKAEVIENVIDEPIVEGALKAKSETTRTNADVLQDWKTNGPEANPKRKVCAFCGQVYYVPCAGDEHLGCMNFHAAEKKRAKTKEKTS